MSSLRDFDEIANKIKTAKLKTIKILNTIIFDETTRVNRRNILSFKGFNFSENSKNYHEKLNTIGELSFQQLVDISALLNIKAEQSEETFKKKILSFLCSLEHEDEIDDDEDDDDEEYFDDGGEGEKSRKNIEREEKNQEKDDEITTIQQKPQLNCSVSFRDIEETIRKFDGKDGFPIEKWIEEFENTRTLLNWSDLQTFIYAKRSLTGIAKLFITSEPQINTWQALRKGLKREFGSRFSSADLHRLMNERRKRRDESVQEYFFVMREIASRGNIEDGSLFDYIINGIDDDDEINKAVLYGASNLTEFKMKLEIYSKMKNNEANKNTRTKYRSKTSEENTYNYPANSRKMNVGFNRGSAQHFSRTCPDKNKESRSFERGEVGHQVKEFRKKEDQSNENLSSQDVDEKSYIMPVRIHDEECTTLIDTGSDVNPIKEDFYNETEKQELTQLDELRHEKQLILEELTASKAQCEMLRQQAEEWKTAHSRSETIINDERAINSKLMNEIKSYREKEENSKTIHGESQDKTDLQTMSNYVNILRHENAKLRETNEELEAQLLIIKSASKNEDSNEGNLNRNNDDLEDKNAINENGLCNSSTSFLRRISEAFQKLFQRRLVITYMDDLICLEINQNEAYNNLIQTLKCAKENRRKINGKKYSFMRRKNKNKLFKMILLNDVQMTFVK